MEEGWLDEEDSGDLVEAIGPDGEFLGWITKREAFRQNRVPQIIETPRRYLDDPYIWYHAQLIDERDLYRDGRDLNDIQLVLLSSALINRRKDVAKEKDRTFEEDMFVNNPELYKAYMEEKKRIKEASGGVEVEQRVPGSVEEFLATLAAFSEGEASDSDKERERADGWLASFLSDEDLDQMSDD